MKIFGEIGECVGDQSQYSHV